MGDHGEEGPGAWHPNRAQRVSIGFGSTGPSVFRPRIWNGLGNAIRELGHTVSGSGHIMFSEIYRNEETIANFGRNSQEDGSFGIDFTMPQPFTRSSWSRSRDR